MPQRRRTAHKALVLAISATAAVSVAACSGVPSVGPGGEQAATQAAPRPPVPDLIGVPGPVNLDGIDHELAGSDQPKPKFYRQQYLPAGQQLVNYQRMVQLEYLGGVSVADVVKTQVGVLDQRKKTDPVSRYDVRVKQEGGEALVDFVLGGKTPTGEELIEWNVYRYVPVNQAGKKGVQLYALSLRAYGKDREEFLKNLKQTRPKEINTVALATVPKVALPG